MQTRLSPSPWQTDSRNSGFTKDLMTALHSGMILPQDYATTFDACAQCGTPMMCRQSELPDCGTAALIQELRAF